MNLERVSKLTLQDELECIEISKDSKGQYRLAITCYVIKEINKKNSLLKISGRSITEVEFSVDNGPCDVEVDSRTDLRFAHEDIIPMEVLSIHEYDHKDTRVIGRHYEIRNGERDYVSIKNLLVRKLPAFWKFVYKK